MAECYNCAAYVLRGQGFRREVYVGSSQRVYWGQRSVSTSSGTRIGIRTVCGRCAMQIDEANRRAAAQAKIIFLIILLLLVAAFLVAEHKYHYVFGSHSWLATFKGIHLQTMPILPVFDLQKLMPRS